MLASPVSGIAGREGEAEEVGDASYTRVNCACVGSRKGLTVDAQDPRLSRPFF